MAMGQALTDADLAAMIHEARDRLAEVINPTPLLESRELNEQLGGRVLLKPECLQRAGSFKIRGAYNAMASLLSEQAMTTVVAWSSGNHAQGVALAAQLLGIRAEIVMPHDTPANKRDAVVQFGGRVIGYDRYKEDREAIARARAIELDCPLIPSYDDWHVIAGQGSAGLEILADPLLASKAPDQVVVCCGGGGLTAGISVAIHDTAPEVAIYAVEPAEANDTARSFQAGKRLRNEPGTRSVCDALLTPTPGAMTFPINQRHVSGVLTVTDREALAAVDYANRRLHLVVEPGGAVALAAALGSQLDCAGKTTVVILSGGNIGNDMQSRAARIGQGLE